MPTALMLKVFISVSARFQIDFDRYNITLPNNTVKQRERKDRIASSVIRPASKNSSIFHSLAELKWVPAFEHHPVHLA